MMTSIVFGVFAFVIHFGPWIWFFNFLFRENALYDFTGGPPHYDWWYMDQGLPVPKNARKR